MENTRMEGGRNLAKSISEGSSGRPLITIITSTFNASSDLQWTIDSIRAQTYPHIQWIIADGASTDGTVNLLKKNEDIIDYWFSEADSGIYDAWSKALPYIRGEWVQFLGAGDELFDKDTYTNIVDVLIKNRNNYDLIYGQLQLISHIERVPLELIDRPWDDIKSKWDGFRPMLPLHPEVFHHKRVLVSNCFGKDYKIAGDSYLLLSNIKRKEPLYFPFVVTKMQLGGVSSNFDNFYKMIKETKRLSRELEFEVPINIYIKENVKFLLKWLIFKSLGKNFFLKIANGYRAVNGKNKIWNIK